MIASRHGDFPVRKGDKIAGTRIIPLVIEKERWIAQRKQAGETPIFPFFRSETKRRGSLPPAVRYKRTDQGYFYTGAQRET